MQTWKALVRSVPILGLFALAAACVPGPTPTAQPNMPMGRDGWMPVPAAGQPAAIPPPPAPARDGKPYQPPASAGSDLPAREYQLTATSASTEIVPGKSTTVWTYNGQLPGPVLRVKQGELLRVTFRNDLSEQTSIHWHGVNGVDNSTDGVAGVTQNAIRPGETYVYEFAPPAPGTYWYHSHQNASEQVDMGLGGILVVEPSQPGLSVDREEVLLLDEYVLDSKGLILSGEDARHGPNAMALMTQSTGTLRDMSDWEFGGYNTFTINGRTSANARPIEVRQGETVRLRIVNMGAQKHRLHLHGHRYRIEARDAVPINEPGLTEATIPIVPGERVDVTFVADNPGTWRLHSHDDDPEVDAGQQNRPSKREQMALLLRYANASDVPGEADRQGNAAVPELDLLAYGTPSDGLGLNTSTRFDRDYTLRIQMVMAMGSRADNDHAGMPGMGTSASGQGMGGMNMGFTVNGKAFPDTAPLPVTAGERVKLSLMNDSLVTHPMHLHGHSFQVLGVDGRAPTGSAVVGDVVDVRPGQRVEIGFIADNTGVWMFHCHVLPHASGGLTVAIPYEGYEQPFAPDPTPGFNIGE